MIERELDGGILTLRLAHGKASALDIDLCRALIEALDDTQDAEAVVLTGTGGIFSAGVDLYQVLEGGGDYTRVFIPLLDEALHRLFTEPKPVVAAINGHAIAGGCILVLASDYKIMAAGASRIGLPELAVSVPFPASALAAVRFAAPNSRMQSLLYRAENLLPEEAKDSGLIDEVAEPEEVLDRAQAVARELAAIPSESFGLTKRALREDAVTEVLRHRGEGYSEDVMKRWADPETHERIKAYLEQRLGR